MRILTFGALVAVQIAASVPVDAQYAANAAAAPSSADPIRTKVRIPYKCFELPNGLRVIVQTDRSAPVVAVSVWYNVGSKQEPLGKTGYAHLFEHLMFTGSENAPQEFINAINDLGGSNVNASTSFDRTNYYETVPRGALERTLYLESDRMGYFLGAMDQTKLDRQRGVVQNEKRQGDNRPFGMVSYRQTADLFPASNPYGHQTIGSMADLDAANLKDIRNWFQSHYGPNNAVVVLAGDIDAPTAKKLMTRYFGAIPRGPTATTVETAIPTLAAPKRETLTDNVPGTTIYRNWVVPGMNNRDAVLLDIGAQVLGGLGSARLRDILVRKEGLAADASAELSQFAQMGVFEVAIKVKPGVDPDTVRHRLDQLMADYIVRGPTADEVHRAATTQVGWVARSLESLTFKSRLLAEGVLYSGDPEKYVKDLAAYTSATPEKIRTAMQKWLSRPVYELTVVPGRRADYVEATTGVTSSPAKAPQLQIVKRSAVPPVAETSIPAFPKVTRAKLSNGIEIQYIRRSVAPVTTVQAIFDGGANTDPVGKEGATGLATLMLERGTTSRDALQLARAREDLGIFIRNVWTGDQVQAYLSTLSSSVAPSLGLFADELINPSFSPAEFEVTRGEMLSRVEDNATDAGGMAVRTLEPAMMGADNPAARPWWGSPKSVRALTRADITEQYRSWFRPEHLKLFVVSDVPFATLLPLFERKFGEWRGTGAAGAKPVITLAPERPNRILLIDRKDSPQTVIRAGLVRTRVGDDAMLSLDMASQVLADGFLSRLNTDIREKKGWAYGAGGGVYETRRYLGFSISSSVQADKTGASLAAMKADTRAFFTTEGVTPTELALTKNSNLRQLVGRFNSNGALIEAMVENDLLGRTDDYYTKLESLIRGQTADRLDQIARANLDPDRLIWVVVGDAKKIRPQLEGLGMPIEERSVE